MTLADAKEIKQNEENNLLDFRLQGKKLTLQDRPSSSIARSTSRLDTAFRAMSATPTLSYHEKHRKTPPWTRPQSADLNRPGHRRKLAAKFDKNGERRHSKRKGVSGGSMNNLLESSSIEDGLDSETSVTASPVPSLTDVLRSNAKLEPGLAGKPPLPPPSSSSGGSLGVPRREHKSLDDIINIKFQQWFPEAIQDTYNAEIASSSSMTDNYQQSHLVKPSKSTENLSDLRNSSRTPETQIMLNYPLRFEAYESPRMDPNKKIPRSHTMETILESDDQSQSQNENRDFLKSKMGQSLNRYYNDTDTNSKKKVTIEEGNDQNKNGESVNGLDKSDSGVEVGDPNGEDKMSGHAYGSPAENYKCDEATSHRTGLNNEDILSWMGNSTLEGAPDKVLGSTYNDILKMLKVLEKEEVESLKLEALSVNRSNNNSACSTITPAGTSCRDILTYLDDLDRSDSRHEDHPSEQKNNSNSEKLGGGGKGSGGGGRLLAPHGGGGGAAKTAAAAAAGVGSGAGTTTTTGGGGRLGQLLGLEPADLAQRVMTLSLQLAGKGGELEEAQAQLTKLSEKFDKHKAQSDAIIKRHQTFIDQLLGEKRLLGEQCASIVKEMEEKHQKSLASLESRHQVEMKKLQEKMSAAEKLRREKWENERIKKIKEQTVKGLEPELERLSRAHGDELSELRRAHDRELAELEAACSRRISAAREQALRDREQAVQEEREAARNKLEMELSEVERSYQEQRRRLLAEVRDEKERLEREAAASLAARSRQLEEKWALAEAGLREKMAALQDKHQMDLKSVRENLEAERQSWLTSQTAALSDKEREIRKAVKEERDRHIEAVIRRLDQEAHEKEKALEAKMMRMKEEYERELKESEESLHETKRKLKEARTELTEYEEMASKLRSQVTQLDCQLATAKQQIERLEYEGSESRSLARSEACSQISALQRQLSEERLKREEAIQALQSEKERELQQVYNRVKEAIAKKDETLRLVGKQRDAALQQCAHLEAMLEQQRLQLSNARK